MKSSPKGPLRAILHDAKTRTWLEFKVPVAVITARTIDEVLPALNDLETACASGAGAAGFITYDAAPAFDPALSAQQSGGIPLLWFAIFDTVVPVAVSDALIPGSDLTTSWTPDISQAAYDEGIALIRHHLHEGNTYQVNFSFRLTSVSEMDPFGYFRRLTQNQPTLYSAYVETEEHAVCSFSPELFFELEGDTIRCMPMKGTERRGRWFEEDAGLGESLRTSEKNRAENVMIVDMVRNDLGRIARPGSVRTTSLFDTERFPGLWQMTSTVEARTDASIVSLLRALFPCASITGAPKPRTMEIIKQLERSPRGLYTGTVGFILPERRAQFNVAIRTVVIDKRTGTAVYGTGGGVVWDSTAAGEYDECLLKAGLLSSSMPEFTLFETMLWKPGEGIALLEKHLDRLCRSAIYFSYTFDRNAILRRIEQCVHALSPMPQRVRIDLSKKGDLKITHNAMEEVPRKAPVRLRLSRSPVTSTDRYLYHKTSCRGIYEERKREITDCDDVVLWNERGEVTETTIANIVCEVDGDIVTPPLASGLLPGVFRSSLLDAGAVKERVVTITDLKRSSRLFICNALRGMLPARLVN